MIGCTIKWAESSGKHNILYIYKGLVTTICYNFLERQHQPWMTAFRHTIHRFFKSNCLCSTLQIIEKLTALNLSVNFARMIKSFLEDRINVVRYRGISSTTYTPMLGIPQGSKLGPLPFNNYINTLYEVIKNSHILICC